MEMAVLLPTLAGPISDRLRQQIEFVANNYGLISGLPQSCMTEVETRNQHTFIEQLSQFYGSVAVINGSTTAMKDVPYYTEIALKEAAAKRAGL